MQNRIKKPATYGIGSFENLVLVRLQTNVGTLGFKTIKGKRRLNGTVSRYNRKTVGPVSVLGRAR